MKGFHKSCSIPCPGSPCDTAKLAGLPKHRNCNLQRKHNRLSWIWIISILLAARQRKWLSLCPVCKRNRRQKCPEQIISAHFLKAISSVSLTVSCGYFSWCYCFALPFKFYVQLQSRWESLKQRQSLSHCISEYNIWPTFVLKQKFMSKTSSAICRTIRNFLLCSDFMKGLLAGIRPLETQRKKKR